MNENEILISKLVEGRKKIFEQLEKKIIGQLEIIDNLIIAIFCKGHCLIVGVPGLAKTLIVSTLSEILDLKFSRVQFTPDLMPSDITGTEIIQIDKLSQKSFEFIKGPIFTNIFLADEINRTPPKTQSALLQSMQEYHVTYAGINYTLPAPFFVIATQNPIEQEGTYPLPEAQLDRFIFRLDISYPSNEDEIKITKMTTGNVKTKLDKILNADEVLEFQKIIREVPISDTTLSKIVKLVNLTRPNDKSPDFIKKWVKWGASVRASQALSIGGKARAILNGRFTVTEEDVISLAKIVLKHRIILNFNAVSEGVSTDNIVNDLIKTVF